MKLKTELLPHQAAAVEKLIKLKVGALFMEQGTGKTLTTLEMARVRLEQGKINHVIWICPCSIKDNIKREIVKHCPAEMLKNTFTICGTQTLSTDYKLVSYLVELSQKLRCFLVVDESLLIKNPRAYRTEHILKIGQNCSYRVILNGTPISRNEADLFAQFYLLDWRILGYKTYWSFAANHLEYDDHKRIRRVLNKDYLTDKIAPYSVQISKKEAMSLPPKSNFSCNFFMTNEQKEHYKEVKDDFLSLEALNEYDTSVIYRTLNALQQVSSGRKIISPATKPIAHKPFFNKVEENPRIERLLKEVNDMGGEQVIIWCKFTHEIEDINYILEQKGYKHSLFYGGLPERKRKKSLDEFEGGVQILVANKSCAGFGLNLQYCRNAIYYSNDWDWATRVQSEDRMHRLGQTKKVNIIDIYAKNSIDERIMRCLSNKESLVDSFKWYLHKKNFAEWLDGKEMEELNDTDRIEQSSKTTGD